MTTLRPSKQIILGRLHEQLFECVSPVDARVVTLGGEGLEAEIWHAHGVKPDNGWLVERNRERYRILKRRYPYRMTHELNALPGYMRRTLGPNAYADLFHMDLCGTVEPNILDLARMLPILMNGEQRMLAVTLADQRQNRSLIESQVVKKYAAAVFGDSWDVLWRHLCTLHAHETSLRPNASANPEKVTLREIGFFLNLLIALSSLNRTADSARYETYARTIPVIRQLQARRSKRLTKGIVRHLSDGTTQTGVRSIQRFVYWSGNSHFRMRTYLLTLEELDEQHALSEAGADLAKLLMDSTYTIVDNERIKTVCLQCVRTGKRRTRKKTELGPETLVTAPETVEPTKLVQGAREDHEQEKEKQVANKPSSNSPSPVVSDAIRRLSPVADSLKPALYKDFLVLCRAADRDDSKELERLRKENEDLRSRLEQDSAVIIQRVRAALESPNTAHAPMEEAEEKMPARSQCKSRARGTRNAHARGRMNTRKQLTKKRGAKKAASPARLPIEEADEIRLDLLRAEHAGGKTFTTAKRKAEKRIPKNGSRTKHPVGAFIAHGKGKFRGDFIARMILRLTTKRDMERLTKELSVIYGTDKETLLAEVRASRVWKKHKTEQDVRGA